VHVGDSRAVPAARRRTRPDHPRPHLRADPRRCRAHHRGGGRRPSAPLAAHARPRRHEPGRGRPLRARGPRRRPLHAVHGWLSGVVHATTRSPRILVEGDPTGAVTRLVDLALERGRTGQRHGGRRRTSSTSPTSADAPARRRGSSRPSSSAPPVSRGCDCACRRCGSPTTPSPTPTGPTPAARRRRAAHRAAAAHRRRARRARPRETARRQAPRRRRKRRASAGASPAQCGGSRGRRCRRRRHRSSPGLLVASLMAVVAVVRRASNGSAGTGSVAVYRGVQGSLLGCRLSSPVVGLRTAGRDPAVLRPGAGEQGRSRPPTRSMPSASSPNCRTGAAQCQTLMPPARLPGTSRERVRR